MARDRKAEHIELSLKPEVQSRWNYFDAYRFEHNALPEIDFSEIDTRTTFLGKTIQAPILISSMTGGTTLAKDINTHLALGAEEEGIPLALGSQRKAIEDANQADTFKIRPSAPSIPILGNVGAVQFNYGFGLEECQKMVDMVEADALILHLNPLQEVLQPEGQTNFSSLLSKIEQIANQLPVPLIAKEIGCGLSASVAQKLVNHGVHILDTAGAGGTSWARIETLRSGEANLGDLYAEWGIPTPVSIKQVASVPGATTIGSGGVRSGLDAAKAIALGADLVGFASPFLQPAIQSAQAVQDTIARITHELKVAMFCVGAKTIEELKKAPLYHRSERL
ncbi:MAG: type 2 isopentenyl-diphosphate Delta-isomerase [Rhodothermaceae bacterium]|nr:type 2 isopentenyl-diphosphate Delta-isomerase [Rhodothermaceae bacterium]